MTTATVVKALRWPLSSVWPLLVEKLPSVRAQGVAREIGEAGELRIPPYTFEQHIGYISLLVYSPTKDRVWRVHIRPVHFGGYDTKVFDFNALRHIEFEYYPKGVTDRHPWDPSTYLKIKNVR